MSTGKQVKTLVIEFLSDGQEHSMQEIREHLLAQGIVLDKKSTLLRNVLFTTKKENPNLINSSRGVYRLLSTATGKVDAYTELNHSITSIEHTLQECLSFNWYSCSDNDLEVARTKVKLLLRLANTITTKLH